MNKLDAIKVLEKEGWTRADAVRALEKVDFSNDPDELTIRRAISLFAGLELIKRQRLQAAQKGMVTKKAKEIEVKNKISTELENNAKVLSSQKVELTTINDQLEKANDRLKKDNKSLKNLIDAIKLKMTIDMQKMMQYEDSEIRKALVKWFNSTQG